MYLFSSVMESRKALSLVLLPGFVLTHDKSPGDEKINEHTGISVNANRLILNLPRAESLSVVKTGVYGTWIFFRERPERILYDDRRICSDTDLKIECVQVFMSADEIRVSG